MDAVGNPPRDEHAGDGRRGEDGLVGTGGERQQADQLQTIGIGGHRPLQRAPADEVGGLVRDAAGQADVAVRTIYRAFGDKDGVILAAISQAHLAAGLPSPREHAAFKLAWKGLRRRVGAAGGATPNRKAPVMALDVAAMVATQPDTLAGLRNRALLALGYAGAFRRSELVALEVSDVERVEGRGLRVTVRRSKTDQVGEGATKAIPFGQGEACPVVALAAWVAAAGIVEGPLFRSITRWGQVSSEGLTGRTVAQLVKDAAETIGRDPSRVSGHSLRAGFVTHALASGVSPADVVQTTAGVAPTGATRISAPKPGGTLTVSGSTGATAGSPVAASVSAGADGAV